MIRPFLMLLCCFAATFTQAQNQAWRLALSCIGDSVSDPVFQKAFAQQNLPPATVDTTFQLEGLNFVVSNGVLNQVSAKFIFPYNIASREKRKRVKKVMKRHGWKLYEDHMINSRFLNKEGHVIHYQWEVHMSRENDTAISVWLFSSSSTDIFNQ